MSTKADLEKEVRRLKTIIRDTKKEEKVVAEKTMTMDNVGYGVFVGEDNRFNMVKLQFNPETKDAVVSEVFPSKRGVSESVRTAQLALGKHITELNKRR